MIWKKQFIIAGMLIFSNHFLYAQEFGFSGDFGYPGNRLNEGYGSFEIKDQKSGLRLGADLTKEAKSLNFWSKGFSASILVKNDLRKQSGGFRGRYDLHLPILEFGNWDFWSESSPALGYLNANYISQQGNSVHQFNQLLFGFSEYLGAKIKGQNHSVSLKIGGEWSGAMLFDDYGNQTEWDNYGVGAKAAIASHLADPLVLRLELDIMRKRFNPEKYFFVEKLTTELGFRSEIAATIVPNIDFVPSFAYRRMEIERNRQTDFERPEFGSALVFHNFLSEGTSFYAKAAYAPWRHKRGEDRVGSVGLDSNSFNGEIYYRTIRDEYSSFVLKERIAGFRFGWRFNISDNQKIKEVEDYGYIKKRKYRFYLDDGISDNAALTIVQQAERLETLRKRIEWSGNNLSWKEGLDSGWGFRDVRQTYKERGGDCDEQSCLNNYLDSLNGYKAYNLSWWDFRTLIGHAVEIVYDPSNNEYYWVEYGIPFKLGSHPNLEAAAQSALRENHRFSAFPAQNSTSVYYSLIDCKTPGTYKFLTSFINIGLISTEQKRPRLEYGYELFTKRNFLFGD